MPRELLPELISDILLRLPAKSVLRFRCLSNSRCDEIDSANFAQIHLKRSIETRSHRKLIFTNSKGLYTADFDEDLKNAVKFNNQFTDPEQYTAIINTCHGLSLLSVYQKGSQTREPGLFLWNPTTRQLKMLPPCENPSPPRKFCYGLGYDSVSDDYKVVRIVTDNVILPKYKLCNPQCVWVFSLKSNSWRKTQDLHLNIMILSPPKGFADGFLYWLYLERTGSKVGCFDFANEVFFTLPSLCSPQDGGLLDSFLDSFLANSSVEKNLVIIEENVLIREHNWNAEVDKYYSVVVDEVNALPGGSWNEAFTLQQQQLQTCSTGLSQSDSYAVPLAYSKDGAYVLLRTDKDIFWYNMEKKTGRVVKCSREIFESDPYGCGVIWESLVSLGNNGIFQV